MGEALARTICNRFGLVSLVARTETPRLTRRAPATCPLPRPASRWPPELTEGAREERGGVLLEIKFKETIRTCLNQTGAKVSLNMIRAIFNASRVAPRGGLPDGGFNPAPWTATHRHQPSTSQAPLMCAAKAFMRRAEGAGACRGEEAMARATMATESDSPMRLDSTRRAKKIESVILPLSDSDRGRLHFRFVSCVLFEI